MYRTLPNVKFHVDNMEEPWPYIHKFDYIFGRYLVSALKDYGKVVQRAYE